jgi:Tol biopolymer transport system component
VPARGGLPRQIVGQGSKPAWSPDGHSIAYQSDERVDVTPSAYGAQAGSTIWMVDDGGERPRQLTYSGRPAGGHAAPAWSPDGRYVGFTVFEAGADNGVWLLSVDSGQTSQLQRGRGLYELAFTPDGSAVYAAGGEALIRRIPFDPERGVVTGPAQTIPVAGVPSARGLAVAPDGRSLAFAGLSLSSQIWAQPVARDGSARGESRPLTLDTSRRNSMPVVSPDGTRVAYLSSRRGEPPNAWVMDIDGGNRVQVSSGDGAEKKPAWFPDGGRLAYVSMRSSRLGLWASDVATRREELVSEIGAEAHRFFAANPLAELELSPSMARMAFAVTSGPEGRRRLFVTPIRSFAPRALGDETVSMGYTAWSPDETRRAVEIKDGSSTQAGVISIATGVLTRLSSERGQTWVRSWSADGRKIAVAALRDGAWSLRWIDVETGQQGVMRPASPPHVYVRYPAWSPSNDVVVFERGELRGNIWTLPLQ